MPGPADDTSAVADVTLTYVYRTEAASTKELAVHPHPMERRREGWTEAIVPNS